MSLLQALLFSRLHIDELQLAVDKEEFVCMLCVALTLFESHSLCYYVFVFDGYYHLK